MASPLCGTGLYANDVLCEVIANLDALLATAESLKDQTLVAMAALQTASEASVAGIESIDYLANTSGVPISFAAPGDPTEPDYSATGPSAPTAPTLGTAPTLTAAPAVPSAYSVTTHSVGAAPTVPAAYTVGAHTPGVAPTIPAVYTVPSIALGATEPTLPAAYEVPDLFVGTAPAPPVAYELPDATERLIPATTINDIFDRAAERLAAVSMKEERDATYMASSMGIGLASASLLKRLEAAQQVTNERISEAALEQSVQEGVWLREDAKTIHGLQVQNWPLKPDLELKAFQTKETLEADVFGKKVSGNATVWALKPGLETELYKTTAGLNIEAEKTEINANVQNWGLKPGLDVELYKTEEGVALNAYTAETNANVQNWVLKPQQDISVHQVQETLELQAYQTLTGESVKNWPLHTDLSVRTWQIKGQTESATYKIEEDAKNQNYQTAVTGFSSEVDLALGVLNAESQRFSVRVAYLQASIQSEAERRGWSEMQLRDVLEQANRSTQYAVEKVTAILEVTRQSEQAVAQLMAGVTQAVYSAADYNLSGSGKQQVSETV